MTTAITESSPVSISWWDDVLADMLRQQEESSAPQICQIPGCEHAAFRTCEFCGKSICREHHRIYYGFCEIDRDYCATCYNARTHCEAMLAEDSEAYLRHHLGLSKSQAALLQHSIVSPPLRTHAFL